jgi:hypothetical protein
MCKGSYNNGTHNLRNYGLNITLVPIHTNSRTSSFFNRGRMIRPWEACRITPIFHDLLVLIFRPVLMVGFMF